MHGGAALQNQSPHTCFRILLRTPLGWDRWGGGRVRRGIDNNSSLAALSTIVQCNSFSERRGRQLICSPVSLLPPQTHTVTLEWSIDKRKGEFTPPPQGGNTQGKETQKQSPTSISPTPFLPPAPSWGKQGSRMPLPQQKGGRSRWKTRRASIVNKTKMPA